VDVSGSWREELIRQASAALITFSCYCRDEEEPCTPRKHWSATAAAEGGTDTADTKQRGPAGWQVVQNSPLKIQLKKL